MFSRLVLRAGAVAPVLKTQLTNRAILSIAARSASTDHIKNWEKANDVYYGPDRDTKNFPIHKQPETCPPTRLGFIPETWFQALYEKTGVTGPYVLGVGAVTFFLSKEIWVVEHGFSEFVAFWIAMTILLKKFGKGLGEYLDKINERTLDNNWYGPIRQAKSGSEQIVADAEKAIWREAGMKHIFEVKKENIDLQLESVYRQRLTEIHQGVKRRLDYQLDLEQTRRRFEQSHMVDWIVDNVVKSITPQQEKESINKCITDLKSLATRA